VLGASVASACTTPNWIVVDPAELGPGADVTVRGGGYAAGPVELRWGGTEGQPLGTTEAGEDGRFTVTVTLPDTEAGRYSVVGVQPVSDGSRLWGYTDVVMPEPDATALPLTAGILGGLLLLAAGLLVGRLILTRRRRSGVPVHGELDAELAQLLESTGIQEPQHDGSRSPVP
jgi:hypothetical protein